MATRIYVALTDEDANALRGLAAREFRDVTDEAAHLIGEALTAAGARDADRAGGARPLSFDDRDRGFGPDHRVIVTLPAPVAEALRDAARRNVRTVRGQAAALIAEGLNGAKARVAKP